MPSKASSVMEEKLRFVFEYERDEQSMTELCRQFGIARETGHVWLRRYRRYGLTGLAELSERFLLKTVKLGAKRQRKFPSLGGTRLESSDDLAGTVV
ncbi:MAG TPA: helix-turn-helix domain-containing protein [Terracidiphilus sp.]|nr:helix-turn-helix domain-containing protein [Terracidiphilus sp.]